MRIVNYSKALLLMVTILLFVGGVAMAASDKVEITADRFVVEESSSRAEFSGNVIIKQPGLTVWANKVVVRYGPGGPSDLKDFEALGNVRIKQAEQSARGDRGVYNPTTKILILYGNVSVTNDSGTITGPQLIVNIASGTSSFPSNKDGGRVNAVFSPQ